MDSYLFGTNRIVAVREAVSSKSTGLKNTNMTKYRYGEMSLFEVATVGSGNIRLPFH